MHIIACIYIDRYRPSITNVSRYMCWQEETGILLLQQSLISITTTPHYCADPLERQEHRGSVVEASPAGSLPDKLTV